MNSEGSGHGLQIHGGLTSQWFESTFCAYESTTPFLLSVHVPPGGEKEGSSCRRGPAAWCCGFAPVILAGQHLACLRGKRQRCSMWGSNPRPLAHKTNTLPTELMEQPLRHPVIRRRVRGLVVMIVACQVMDPGSIPGERIYLFFVRVNHAARNTTQGPAPFCDSPPCAPPPRCRFYQKKTIQ